MNVQVGKVDADREKALGDTYDIASFPTIIHFPKRDRPMVSAASVDCYGKNEMIRGAWNAPISFLVWILLLPKGWLKY